jgi:anaerobic magnesium-protoporphyrin IX monomethyl ester cyclase
MADFEDHGPARSPVRVALVCPRLDNSRTWSSLFEPLGLVYLAHVASTAGHVVRVFDQADPTLRSPRALLRAIGEFSPELVGFTATTVEFVHAVGLAGSLKAEHPDVPVVFGGSHVSADPSAIEEPAIDLVIRGEGERPFLALLAAGHDGDRLGEIAGLAFKHGAMVVRNPDQARITDLGELGIPDRSSVDLGRYRWLGVADVAPHRQRFATVAAARGCPHRCMFCQSAVIRGRQRIARPVQQVLDEIELLVDRHGVNLVAFVDETFTADRDRVAHICDELRARQLPLAWCATARAADLDLPLARRMRAAGCCLLNVGIETADEEGLSRLRKDSSLAEIRAGIAALYEADIQVLGSAMIGFPWEDASDLDRSLGLLRELPLDVLGLSFCVPLAGTPLRRIADEEDLIFDHDLSHWTSLRPVMRTRHLSAPELLGLYQKTQRSFYRGPGFRRRMTRLLARRPARVLSIAESIARSAAYGGLRDRFVAKQVS